MNALGKDHEYPIVSRYGVGTWLFLFSGAFNDYVMDLAIAICPYLVTWLNVAIPVGFSVRSDITTNWDQSWLD